MSRMMLIVVALVVVLLPANVDSAAGAVLAPEQPVSLGQTNTGQDEVAAAPGWYYVYYRFPGYNWIRSGPYRLAQAQQAVRQYQSSGCDAFFVRAPQYAAGSCTTGDNTGSIRCS